MKTKLSGNSCPLPGSVPHGNWTCKEQEIPITGTSFLDENAQTYLGKLGYQERISQKYSYFQYCQVLWKSVHIYVQGDCFNSPPPLPPKNGYGWPKVAQGGPKWSRVAQMAQGGPNVPKWPKVDQSCSNGPNGPKWPRVAKSGPELPKLDQMAKSGPGWSK